MRHTFSWYAGAITAVVVLVTFMFTGDKSLHIYFIGCLGIMIHERVDQIARSQGVK